MLWVTSVVIRPPLASPSKELHVLGQFLLKLLPGGIGAGGEVIKFTISCLLNRTDVFFSYLVKIGTFWEDVNAR